MLFRAFFLTALVGSLNSVAPLKGQAVISTRSGVVHYFEGAVSLDGQPLDRHLGKFTTVPPGSELRTALGRAEVLLTPGVFLRMDENSAIRMVSNSLDDTRVELVSGSAIVDAAAPADETSVTLSYKDWKVRFPEKGVYRLDTTPARVTVRDGQAEVIDPATSNSVMVDSGMDLPLALALVPEQTLDQPFDSLNSWSRGRADSISADNQIAQSIQDPATLADQDPLDSLYAGGVGQYGGLAQNGFTQFPLIGLSPPVTPSVYSAYGAYNPLYPYQPGFYSMYLPGYTYMPIFLGLPRLTPNGIRSSIYVPPPRTGVSPLAPGVVVPRSLGSSGVTPYRPAPIGRTVVGSSGIAPAARPAPAVIRPAAPPPVVHPAPAAPRVGGTRR